MDDDPPTFDTASDAWAYLADERRRGEDDLACECGGEPYTTIVETLDAYSSAGHGPDSVRGPTPGYDEDNDLGIAYTVMEVPDERSDDHDSDQRADQ
jgi:hypothetical protein